MENLIKEGKKLTWQVALFTLLAVGPFTILWFGILSYVLGSFPPTDVSILDVNQKIRLFLTLFGLHEVVVFFPTWGVVRLTNTNKISVWAVTHIPGFIIIAWFLVF